MAKSYKQLYEESKLTEEEINALKLVVDGCNTNPKLRGWVRYIEALKIVNALIERLEK